MKDWIDSSILVNDPEVEICYQLKDKFFIGNPNDIKEINNDSYYINLNMPSFKRTVYEIARSAEVSGNEIELSNYYKSILKKAKENNKTYQVIHHYFWIRLWLWQTEKNAYISFPWYDTVDEIKSFFKVFKEDSAGQIFFDADQAWEIEVFADNNHYYIKQTDPDKKNFIIENLKIEKELIERKISILESRINMQIRILAELVGIDLWTNREYINLKL